MRTETITREIFTFEELSPEAQAKAIQDYRGKGIDTAHNWDEARQSVSAFCDLFDCKTGRDSWLDIIAHDSETRHDLTGQRLRTYLINNYPSAFYERKYRNSFHRAEKPTTPHRMRQVKPWSRGGYWVTLRSNFETESSCPFTGVCYDEDLLQPLKEFIKQPDGRTFEQLVSEAGESLRISLESEDDYRNSDEGIAEDIQAQDLEFLEDGTPA